VHDPAHNIFAAAGSKGEAKQQANTTETKGNRLAFRGDKGAPDSLWASSLSRENAQGLLQEQ